MTNQELVQTAFSMLERAYVPYSQFPVGAALRCKDGSVFTGCNIENAAYGPSNCAERTAFFTAVSQGEREFAAIAIVGGKEDWDSFCAPCGVCRQVMAEFCPSDFRILLGRSDGQVREFTLAELLPQRFGPENLQK